NEAQYEDFFLGADEMQIRACVLAQVPQNDGK
ncbi:MAG: hypothetical protein RL748_795, partial [Pseudomonadota bacterium]